MGDANYLTNQFLIAMPNLMDPNFFHSVTYICEHNEQGAMGIVINQTLDLTLGELMEQMKVRPTDNRLLDTAIYRGGPVESERGFVLHRPVGDWESTMAVTDDIAITTSSDIIHAMGKGEGPAEALVALGYAGWGPGQLEQEMLDNAWLSGPADAAVMFATPLERRWEAAARLLGVDIHRLTGDAGHA